MEMTKCRPAGRVFGENIHANFDEPGRDGVDFGNRHFAVVQPSRD